MVICDHRFLERQNLKVSFLKSTVTKIFLEEALSRTIKCLQCCKSEGSLIVININPLCLWFPTFF